jgi:hypothetical protein
MSRRSSLRGLALSLGVFGLVASCSVPFSDLQLEHAARGAMFDSYVAIGNSITAGFQSSGITDSTQRRSYAFLLAQSMGTRFAYPSLNNPGCPSLINNFLLQSRVSAIPCSLRGQATDGMNNLGVPGAWSYDPNSQSSPSSTGLTQFFLGGKSQVQRAREMNPTFASIWIGNNDVLGPSGTACTTAFVGACTVTFANMTNSTTFSATYDAIVDSLLLTSPNLKGVLIGVVDVTNAPLYFAVTALTANTNNIKTAFDAIACGPGTSSTTCVAGATTINPNCSTSPGNKALINIMLAFTIRTTPAIPALISCVQNVPAAPVGDLLVLDSAEAKAVSDTVAKYNTYISAKATALGWAYYNPNVDLVALRTTGTVVRTLPLVAAGNFSATAPFGTGMSLDGVHPNAAVHLIVANAIITAINAKYGSTLPAVF